MPLAELAGACREETSKYLRRQPFDDSFCFEVIRRAAADRDEAAWDAMMTQYRGVVLGWIRQHPAAAATREDEGYWVNRTFERFWSAQGPERFARFPDVASILKYLKMCANSVLLDNVRSKEAIPAEPLDETVAESVETPDSAAIVVERLAGRELWEVVLRHLADDTERQVVYLSFVLGLPPREVQARLSDLCPTIADVYRVKRNAIERLRRSPEIRAFLP
jgi:DNA-directed RNA polymerase specialized sigma24 family protein